MYLQPSKRFLRHAFKHEKGCQVMPSSMKKVIKACLQASKRLPTGLGTGTECTDSSSLLIDLASMLASNR